MKRILLLSDTHGFMDESILKHVRGVDEVWHAGDIGSLSVTDQLKELKPLRAVYGNIDGHAIRSEFPLHERFTCENVEVWMTHIGGYPGRYSPDIRNEIMKNPPELFITGHSHILKVMNDKKLGLLHMNPGAVGNYGFQKTRTMLRFEIDHGDIRELHVIEFDRKMG
jgi:putative phosphoesterase